MFLTKATHFQSLFLEACEFGCWLTVTIPGRGFLQELRLPPQPKTTPKIENHSVPPRISLKQFTVFPKSPETNKLIRYDCCRTLQVNTMQPQALKHFIHFKIHTHSYNHLHTSADHSCIFHVVEVVCPPVTMSTQCQ
ncbi:hypothetical protein DPMN_106049 [Dreissena polymorpha]|uniref:Uncharacterized protein n=1 Tax=Dreissena polymorpha TaxID=45954 RepID=A0A9D4QID2_DREPO|nr:hypothetical protein DPMN_106049 [Dreissena polymorpha]